MFVVLSLEQQFQLLQVIYKDIQDLTIIAESSRKVVAVLDTLQNIVKSQQIELSSRKQAQDQAKAELDRQTADALKKQAQDLTNGVTPCGEDCSADGRTDVQ